MSTPQSASEASEPIIYGKKMRRMRGGLGRTLLIAFLLLAITPVSLVSLYAINRTNQETKLQQEELLLLQAEAFRDELLLASQQIKLSLSSQNDDDEISNQWFFTIDGETIELATEQPLPSWLDLERSLTQWQVGGVPVQLWVTIPVESVQENKGAKGRTENKREWKAELLPLEFLFARRMSASLAKARVYIQQDDAFIPLSPNTPALTQVLIEELNLHAQEEGIIYPSYKGQHLATLFSRISLEDDLSLVLMLPSEEALGHVDNNPTGNLAATLVGTALLAALVTTVAAALVTRRITRPLYELTQAAVRIAQGDSKQRVQIKQDNELGILALAFNTMTEQLHESLETLEQRVAKRTEALRQANAEIAERARRLELGAEIGTILSRYDQLEALLSEGCSLIADCFDYQDVSVLFLTPRKEAALSVDESMQNLAARMLQNGQAIFDEDHSLLVLPLRVADQILGALVLTHKRYFQEHEIQPLQILADSFAVAIENARASEMERTALKKLQQIEKRRTEFLGEMSHELSTSLNAIIGFSQLMLKEIEGPLTDIQRTDLTHINRNGTHLLSLLDGILEVIDKDAG